MPHLGVTGDGSWDKARDGRGTLLELCGVRRATVRTVAQGCGEISGCVQKGNGKTAEFGPGEIVHFPLPIPTKDPRGESP